MVRPKVSTTECDPESRFMAFDTSLKRFKAPSGSGVAIRLFARQLPLAPSRIAGPLMQLGHRNPHLETAFCKPMSCLSPRDDLALRSKVAWVRRRQSERSPT